MSWVFDAERKGKSSKEERAAAEQHERKEQYQASEATKAAAAKIIRQYEAQLQSILSDLKAAKYKVNVEVTSESGNEYTREEYFALSSRYIPADVGDNYFTTEVVIGSYRILKERTHAIATLVIVPQKSGEAKVSVRDVLGRISTLQSLRTPEEAHLLIPHLRSVLGKIIEESQL